MFLGSTVTPRLINRIVFNENNLRAIEPLSVSERNHSAGLHADLIVAHKGSSTSAAMGG